MILITASAVNVKFYDEVLISVVQRYPCLWNKKLKEFKDLQEAQLMLTTGATRLAVSRGQQTWYHFWVRCDTFAKHVTGTTFHKR